jgi:protein-disulfide isomerase/uncharacterized membrane protein
MSRPVPAKKTPIQLYFLLALSLIGVGTSVALSQHFYSTRSGTSGFRSFCNVSETMNCDLVSASPYSELIFGIPIASFAAGWFLALFIVSLFALNPYWRREAVRCALGLTGFGSLMAFPYLWIMATQLKTYCLLCFGVDAINWISLALVLSLKPEGFSIHKPDWSKWKVFASTVAICLFVTIVVLKSQEELNVKSSDIEEMARTVLDKPVISVGSGIEFPSIGPKDAPITIVEFSDFQCPWCKVGAMVVHSVYNRYPGKIRIVFRNFPLDHTCNPLLQSSPHPVACEAARSSICAYQQGKFEPVYEDFFENQTSFGKTKPTERVKNLSLNWDQFQTCMNSPDSLNAITRDIEEGKLLGVNATPTFFVNGRKMEGPFPAAAWNKIVDRLLAK